jgi:RNA-directed DNA polymerase
MDFKDFFPSIKPIDLLNVIEKRYTLSHFEQSLIVNYLFRKVGRAFELSVRALSSPMISNLA